MRGSGGRTTSRGSLRGDPKGEGPRAKSGPQTKPQLGRRSRSGDAAVPAGAPDRLPRIASRRGSAASGVQVALNTSCRKSTPKVSFRKRGEMYVPVQRNLFDEGRVFLPLTGSDFVKDVYINGQRARIQRVKSALPLLGLMIHVDELGKPRAREVRELA
jgi:hypothetical protein